MSKYIKLEDAINKMDEWFCEPYTPTELLSDLPTIEVSEEVLKATKNFNAYTIADENAEMGMRTQIEPIIEVSEDCISREDAINALIAHFIPQTYTGEEVEQATKLARKIMEDAPSVVPSRAEGGWKRHPIPENRAWDICTACGTGCRRRHYGFNEDGTEWVEQANYPFCPNCGAKMKG